MTNQENLPTPESQQYYIAPETEKAVLGALLQDPDMLSIVRGEQITASDFECTVDPIGGRNSDIFQIMCELADTVGQFRFTHVKERIRLKKNLTPENTKIVHDQLCDLMDAAANTNPIKLGADCRQLKDFSVRREALAALGRVKQSLPEVGDAAELIEQAQTNLANLITHRTEQKKSLADKLDEFMVKLQEAAEGKCEMGLMTGYEQIDEIIDGFRPGELILVGARPSMGKTTFVLNVLLNMVEHLTAQKKTDPILFFSLEMTHEAIHNKLIARQAQVDARMLRGRAQFTSDEWGAIHEAKGDLADSCLEVFDSTDNINTVAAIEGKVQRFISLGKKPAFIAIDYAQKLLLKTTAESINRTAEATIISGQLQNMAKRLGIPVLVLSQLSRANETRQNRRPEMSDLRETGAWEQDADIIMFLYRDKYYNPNTPDGDVIEVIVKKHRQGEIGTAVLEFWMWCQRMWNTNKRASELPSQTQPVKEAKQPRTRYGGKRSAPIGVPDN